MIEAETGGFASNDLHWNAIAAERSAARSRIAHIASQCVTGIDPHTGLASDFLNQFNEVSMLLEFGGRDSEFGVYLREWRARSYVEHFKASRLRDSALIIEAYALCPRGVRRRFDALSLELSGRIARGIADLGNAEGDAAPTAGRALAATVRAHVATLSAIIHPAERAPGNAEISDLFARR